MIYNYARGTDGGFVVTGVDNGPLYGLNGFTEAQAREVAFHLNVARDRGRANAQAAIKTALGFSGVDRPDRFISDDAPKGES